jgi:hypothetical protein
VAAQSIDKVLIWTERSETPRWNILVNSTKPTSVFVTSNGVIYFHNSRTIHTVDKWAPNATNSVPVVNITSRCRSLFIDINDTLYCSLDHDHKVVTASLLNESNTTTVIAGNGTSGSEPHMLAGPKGIFVDMQLNLYVADCENNRIQFFQPGQLNGTTVAVEGALGTITLRRPHAVILDADGYLFIADFGNERIIGSGSAGFRCLIGCSSGKGTQIYQLNEPKAISFDSDGNIFVVDAGNRRIQKFLLASNSCGKSTVSN